MATTVGCRSTGGRRLEHALALGSTIWTIQVGDAETAFCHVNVLAAAKLS